MFPQQIIEELLSVAHVQAVAARAGVIISNFDKDFGYAIGGEWIC
jgi:hypothetical protein